MQTRFICPQHKQWLFSHPESAKAHMQDAMETAVYYRDRKCWSDALAFQGCAFETAEILLAKQSGCLIETITAFTANAILLSENYASLGDPQDGLTVLQRAQQRLTAEISLHLDSHPAKKCLQDCISALEAGARFRDIFHSRPMTTH